MWTKVSLAGAWKRFRWSLDLWSGSGRLFQADGPAVAKAQGGLMRCVGDVVRAVDVAQRNAPVTTFYIYSKRMYHMWYSSGMIKEWFIYPLFTYVRQITLWGLQLSRQCTARNFTYKTFAANCKSSEFCYCLSLWWLLSRVCLPGDCCSVSARTDKRTCSTSAPWFSTYRQIFWS